MRRRRRPLGSGSARALLGARWGSLAGLSLGSLGSRWARARWALLGSLGSTQLSAPLSSARRSAQRAARAWVFFHGERATTPALYDCRRSSARASPPPVCDGLSLQQRAKGNPSL